MQDLWETNLWHYQILPVNNLTEGIYKIKCKYGHGDNLQMVKFLKLNTKIDSWKLKETIF